jgi:hypothetical protein
MGALHVMGRLVAGHFDVIVGRLFRGHLGPLSAILV